MRNRFEPWYSVKMNSDLASPESYQNRRQILAEILEKHLNGRNIRKVLDHGGDHGDLVSGLIPGAAAYVYDISGVPPATNVTATTDPIACQADLIINSNVLEHVGFPRALVSEILAASPKGGLVYLEVPCELPFGPYRVARRIAQIGLTMLMRPSSTLPLLQLPALYLMHEHINYFTEESLVTLMKKGGGEVVASGSYLFAGAGGRANIAWCLGSRPTFKMPNVS